MDNNNHPHANFAVSVFSNLTFTREILKPLLPIEVSKRIDWKTIKLTNSSFVDARHIVPGNDIIFIVSKKRAPLSALFKRKS